MPPPVQLMLVEKAELVLICGEHYKTVREAGDIFNERHPDKQVHYSTISRILNNFKRQIFPNFSMCKV